MKINKHFLSYPTQFFLEWKNVSDSSCTKYQNTYFTFTTLNRKSWPLWDNVEEYCTAGQAIEDNMEHASFMLDTCGYKHTLTICNSSCFPTTKIGARTASLLPYTYIAGLVYDSVWFSEFTAIISLNKKERGYLYNWNTHCSLWGMNWTIWGSNTAPLLCDGTLTPTTSSSIYNKASDLSWILDHTVLNNSAAEYKDYFVTWKYL
jgi:hypothetical protein